MILLVTQFPFDAAFGGAFILRSNVRALAPRRIRWINLSHQSGAVPFNDANVTTVSYAPPAFGNVRLRLGKFWQWYARVIWARRIAGKIADDVKQLNPEVVWLVADFGLAPVALRLLPALQGRHVHVSVHDSPVPSAEREHRSPAFLHEVSEFLQCLSKVGCTADAVTEELLAEVVPFASRSAVVTLPVDPHALPADLQPPRKQGPLTIGFSGNFLGEAEFGCFVSGLRLWSQRTAREWRIRAFGRRDLSKFDERVEAHGFTPPDRVRAALRECDLLLLPCPIERPELRTSLPTKLVSYVEIGRMIFAFAPKYSSTRRIVEQAALGFVLSRRDPAAVANGIDQLLACDINSARSGWHSLVQHRFRLGRIKADLESVLLSDPVSQ